MPFDALFSCRNNKERSEIVQKNIACHQKLWYYENEKSVDCWYVSRREEISYERDRCGLPETSHAA